MRGRTGTPRGSTDTQPTDTPNWMLPPGEHSGQRAREQKEAMVKRYGPLRKRKNVAIWKGIAPV